MNGDLGRGLGHAMFLRVRGREYSQIVREWVTPAAMGLSDPGAPPI